ncbi:MAG: citrate lyase acyl carrier protein [Clostridiales bacterium]|jgi:citrate lyase subunit gamma (acyl carrier protein)|nr:citrate lyase acyl carrier protein [Clostridiales bacterium]MDD7259873.1 citrate lyase acyl carrier protein [Eubacteriales bacterium]
MKLITIGNAGTMESNDIMITVEPSDAGGVQVELTSSVYQQFGKQIIAVIRETAADYGVENALITAVDKGALDCTVRARVATALTRAAEWHDYTWEVRQDV